MTDSAYGFRSRTPSAELDGFSLEQLDWDVEARDIDGDAGAYVARSRRAYVNIVEGELVARDAQRCSVSPREVAEGEPAEIVPDAVFESRDDGHEGGGIDSRHAGVNRGRDEQGT